MVREEITRESILIAMKADCPFNHGFQCDCASNENCRECWLKAIKDAHIREFGID